jgi:hypothetical protein
MEAAAGRAWADVSVRRRYSVNSATVTVIKLWRRAKSASCGWRAIVPSSFITSQITAAG